MIMSNVEKIKPVLPAKGQIIIEDIKDLLLCKPRLIPLKSFTLEKLEKMQKAAQKSEDSSTPAEE